MHKKKIAIMMRWQNQRSIRHLLFLLIIKMTKALHMPDRTKQEGRHHRKSLCTARRNWTKNMKEEMIKMKAIYPMNTTSMSIQTSIDYHRISHRRMLHLDHNNTPIITTITEQELLHLCCLVLVSRLKQSNMAINKSLTLCIRLMRKTPMQLLLIMLKVTASSLWVCLT